MEVENNKMLFDLRDWVIIAPFMFNSVADIDMFASCTLMERHVYIELHLYIISYKYIRVICIHAHTHTHACTHVCMHARTHTHPSIQSVNL